MKNIMKILTAAAMLLPASVLSAQERWAVVNTSSCFLRSAADYESSNETQCLMGTVLKVTGEDRYWRKVDAPDYRGCWTNDLVLAYMTEEEKDAYISSPKLICTAEYSHIWSEPDVESARISDFTMGNLVRRSGADAPCGEWLPVITGDGRKGWVRASDTEDFSRWAASRNPDGEALCEFARRFIGVPYMWGGNSVKHFDCSGFTKFVYWMNGIVLPRNAREQIYCGVEVPYDFSAMQAGDLIFYGRKSPDGRPLSVSHVAMYIGDGRIIHSSQLIRVNSIRPGDADYYDREPIAVRRMLGSVDCGKGVIGILRDPFCFKQ